MVLWTVFVTPAKVDVIEFPEKEKLKVPHSTPDKTSVEVLSDFHALQKVTLVPIL